MDSERRKKLNETMKKFNKLQKDEIFTMANESPVTEVISFGIKSLDNFFGGGVPLRKFTVDYGAEDTGKSTRALQLTANAQKQGKIVCYIDMERKFDREWAEKLGVNLDDLVLIQSAKTAEQAMDAINLLAIDKVVDLIIVDSIQAMSPKGEQSEKKGKIKSIEDDTMALLARKLGQFFRMTSAEVFRANMAVYMIAQIRVKGIGSFYVRGGLSGGKALAHWMSICTKSRCGQNSDAPIQKFKEYFIDPDGKIRYVTKKEPIGFDCVLQMEKSHIANSAKKNAEIHIPFVYGKGFVDEINDSDEVPIVIDETMTDDEKEIIKKYLIEKKPDEAMSMGLIPKIKGEHADTIIADDVQPKESKIIKMVNEDLKAIEEVKIKKKRGRPKKDK